MHLKFLSHFDKRFFHLLSERIDYIVVVPADTTPTGAVNVLSKPVIQNVKAN